MTKSYSVLIYFENGEREFIVMKSNAIINLQKTLTSSHWIKCEETDRYFNMSKVVSFQVVEEVIDQKPKAP